jgi:hypothetical protein
MATHSAPDAWEETDKSVKGLPTHSQISSDQSCNVSATMPKPTLGCQIAPDYQHYNSESESESTDTESEANSPAHEVGDDVFPIEKAETQYSRGITPALSKINTQRSRASRKQAAQAPVGFWHWEMVRKLQSSGDSG